MSNDLVYVVAIGNGYYCGNGKDTFSQVNKQEAVLMNLDQANTVVQSLRSNGLEAHIEFI
ncbi:MAG: hypothetical protein E7255_06195 [Lachnospiraceae bacterium]|nr:hypothetical protein [Lachnospiraceae bacterium]